MIYLQKFILIHSYFGSFVVFHLIILNMQILFLLNGFFVTFICFLVF